MQPKRTDEPATPSPGDPEAEREARFAARTARREAPGTRPRATIPPRRRPLQAMRLVTMAGIVGIGVVVAAVMASQSAQGWLIGLVVAVLSLVLAALRS
jgi:hypothetical protein